MAHGGYGRRRVAARQPLSRRVRGLGVEKKQKTIALKNQVRSVERLLRKNLPNDVREAQVKKLEKLKEQHELQRRLSIERKISERDKKIKFFERRKIERRIRRLERLQRTSSYRASDAGIADQLSKLKEDLEYVRFFPKTEKYVSLLIGGNEPELVERRNKLRKQIRANLMAASASGNDLEETGSEDEILSDIMEDAFFSSGSDEAYADDEWTDRSMREQASSTSGKAASGMSSDEKNHRQASARTLMPPPRVVSKSFGGHGRTRFSYPSTNEKFNISAPSSILHSGSGQISKWTSSDTRTCHSSNLSSNSDVNKPQKKRRPKKKQV